MCVEMWTTEFYTTYGILYELPHQDVPKIFHISVCINAALSAFPLWTTLFCTFSRKHLVCAPRARLSTSYSQRRQVVTNEPSGRFSPLPGKAEKAVLHLPR